MVRSKCFTIPIVQTLLRVSFDILCTTLRAAVVAYSRVYQIRILVRSVLDVQVVSQIMLPMLCNVLHMNTVKFN